MPKIAVIYNPKSGNTASTQELLSLMKKRADVFCIFNLEEKNIFNLLDEIVKTGFTTIISAGGDGTISTVANALLTKHLDVKFGVLPVGTFNHFAKDIGMPLNLEQALDVIIRGNTSHVDVAKVNDVFFLNNSSLGLYPHIVKERDTKQKRGYQKLFESLKTLRGVLSWFRFITIEFESEGKKVSKKTPFVFIGNNKYELTGFNLGTRAKLNEGILSLCIASPVNHVGLLRLLFHAIFGRLIEQKDFNVIGLQECIISSRKGSVLVSLDGEVKTMKSPLIYKTVPRALKIITP